MATSSTTIAASLPYITWGLVTFLSALAGSYLGSYVKKKGENLATHEDIEKLVDQVYAVTKATKEIEARISHDVWDRQTRWEVKRDVLFEAARDLSEVDEALLTLASTIKTQLENPDQDTRVEAQRIKERWHNAITKFAGSRFLVAIACTPEVSNALDDFNRTAVVIALQVISIGMDPYRNSRQDLDEKLFAARRAIRKELGIEGDPAPLIMLTASLK